MSLTFLTCCSVVVAGCWSSSLLSLEQNEHRQLCCWCRSFWTPFTHFYFTKSTWLSPWQHAHSTPHSSSRSNKRRRAVIDRLYSRLNIDERSASGDSGESGSGFKCQKELFFLRWISWNISQNWFCDNFTHYWYRKVATQRHITQKQDVIEEHYDLCHAGV